MKYLLRNKLKISYNGFIFAADFYKTLLYMKKIIYLSILFAMVMFSKPCVSQNIGVNKVKFGVRLGMNGSFFSQKIGYFGMDYSSDLWENYLRFSPVFGIVLNYEVSKIISVQGELLYSFKGGSVRKKADVLQQTNNGLQAAYNYRNMRVDYLEMPILVNIDLHKLLEPTSDRLCVNLQTGIAPSINTSASLRQNSYSIGSGYGLVDAKENWSVSEIPYTTANGFNTSIIIGLMLHEPSKKYFMDIRYTRSLFDTFAQERISSNSPMKATINTFSMSFGRFF